MSCSKLSPNELMATSAAIPTTMEEINSRSLAIFFRKSRKAINKIQLKLRMSLPLNFTALYPDNPVCPRGQTEIMGYQDQGGPQSLVHIKNHVFDHLSGFRIQIACGLVGKKYFGLVG